jgi:hypothetical protein
VRAVTHIAGSPVLVGRKGRQRCAWCGELLLRVDGDEMVHANANGSPPTAPKPWELGALVEVAHFHQVARYSVVPHADGDLLPPNTCFGRLKLRVLPRGEP